MYAAVKKCRLNQNTCTSLKHQETINMKHAHLKQQASIVDYESLIVFWTYFEEKQLLGFPSRKSSIVFLPLSR
jgi:hypothetical protein